MIDFQVLFNVGKREKEFAMQVDNFHGPMTSRGLMFNLLSVRNVRISISFSETYVKWFFGRMQLLSLKCRDNALNGAKRRKILTFLLTSYVFFNL